MTALTNSRSGSNAFVDATTDDSPATEAVQPSHPESLSVVSESDYRCTDESDLKLLPSERYVIKKLHVKIISSRFDPHTSLPPSRPADLRRSVPEPMFISTFPLIPFDQ